MALDELNKCRVCPGRVTFRLYHFKISETCEG